MKRQKLHIQHKTKKKKQQLKGQLARKSGTCRYDMSHCLCCKAMIYHNWLWLQNCPQTTFHGLKPTVTSNSLNKQMPENVLFDNYFSHLFCLQKSIFHITLFVLWSPPKSCEPQLETDTQSFPYAKGVMHVAQSQIWTAS